MTLEAILDDLIARRGSDLHLVVGEPPIFRVNGALIRREETASLNGADMDTLLYPDLSEAQRATLDQGRDVEKSLRLAKNRYRMQIFHERGNLAASLRVVPTIVPTMEDLELTREHHAILHTTLERKRGLIIVTGVTGSGRSTTMAAMIEEINRSRVERIITIEDPIEYEFTSKLSVISQRCVGEDIPSFPQGMRAAYREDPDVLLVGETRDLETMMMTLTHAEAGTLVFSTLSVATASSAVLRVVDAWPKEQQPVIRRLLATNLLAIVAQKLLPRASGKGRAAVQEIMLGTPRVRQMIADGHADLTVAIEAGRELGMRTMDDDLVRLVESGVVSPDVAWFHLQDKERMPRRDAA